MRLDDFLKLGGTPSAVLAPTKPVSFKGIGLTKDRQQFVFDAAAQFVFVNENEVAAIRTEARAVNPAGSDLYHEDVAYRTLAVALRDADDPAVLFASNHEQLRRSLVSPVAQRLMREYQEFVAAEFKDNPDPEDMKQLAEEAEGNS